MATLEKLVRTVEALKLHQTPSVSLDETMTKKDKISHCVSVTDVLCSQGIKNSPESAKYLSMAMEMFFTLLDDPESDVRMVADENLNRMTRSLGESNMGKLQVELYKEIKKNGSQRCVRAALSRFSGLAKYIRAAKCRPYLVNLLPCLDLLSKRSEEQVHETMASSFPQLMSVLGPHSNDNEIRILLKSFLANVGSSSAVIRRTTATILTVLVTNCRNPKLFSSWLLNTVTQLVVPLHPQTCPHLLSGVLGVTRQIVTKCPHSHEVEPLLLLYELCIKLTEHPDHNLVTGSLETLQQVVRCGPSLLLYLLTSNQGLGQPRLTLDQDQGTTEPEVRSSLPTDPSLQSLSDVMENSVVSLHPNNSSHDADSEGEEPREELVLPRRKVDRKEVEVGSLQDKTNSLHYLARKLCCLFLLSEEKGETISEREVRVSVKTLALTCLGELLSLSPQLWHLSLLPDTSDTFTSVEISDLVVYLDHQDPGLRGATARLVCRVLRGACVESGGRLSRWFQDRERDHRELLSLLTSLLSDESSITLRQVVAGASLLLPCLVQCEESREVVGLLERLTGLVRNKYWLVRLELCHLLLSPDSLATTYTWPRWEATRLDCLTTLLSDEDSRVRSAAAQALVQISPASTVSSSQPLTSQAALSTAAKIFSVDREAGGDTARFETLHRILEMLSTATSRTTLCGCLEFLALYSVSQDPVLRPGLWGIYTSPARRSPASNCPGLSLLTRTVSLLSSSPPCQDLTVHSNLLTVSARLYAGLAHLNLLENAGQYEGVTSLVPGHPDLAEQAELLLAHLIKLLSILHHVIEEQVPSLPSSKPSLPSLPNSTLSPIKKKSSEPSTPVSPPATEKTFSLKEEKKLRGQFYGSPFYMKQFELVRASYGIYKSSLDPQSEEKLLTFTESVLDCFSALLDFSLGNDASIGKMVEECLGYVKSCLVISSSKTLLMVKTLLKCLFKCNEPFNLQGKSLPGPPISISETVFEHLITTPYSRMTVDFHLVMEGGDLSTIDSSPNPRPVSGYSRKSLSRTADRSSLAGYIRMFEPIVIKALKLYTVSSDTKLQCQVLQLLIQLVRLRVNYCLLDSDQIFIGFVTKQLEAIQEGEINNARLLVPHIFEFLILLSYEKYHSKTIITKPKILQLIEGLGAARDEPHSLVIPALEVVALDLFSSNQAGDEELETQQEVVVNMLLKQLGHSQVWGIFSRILALVGEDEGGEDRSRKLTRQIVEVIIPLLCSHSVELSTRHHLDTLKSLFSSLSPGCLRPCDRIISALMSVSCDLSNLTEVVSWLGFAITTFLTIFRLSPEEAVLGRLQELGIMLGSAGSSLLDTSMEESLSDCSLQPPEMTLSVFYLHLLGSGVSKLHQLVFCPATREQEERRLLEQELGDLLVLLTFILQSGRCPRIARAVVSVAASSQSGALHSADLITDLALELSPSCPSLASQWLYCLVLLDRASPQVWARVLCISRGPANTRVTDQSEPASSLNIEIIRKCAISILANHLVNNTTDTELLAWFLSSQIREIVNNIADSQIREFVNIVHRQGPASGLFLEAVSARIESMKSPACFNNILVCLHNLHPSHTGRLVCLLVNKFLASPVLAIASKAAQLASRRVEMLLGEREETVHDQLSQSEVAALKESLARRHLTSRHSRLVGLINRLAMTFYDLSPLESSEGRKFNPCSLSGVELDKTWYLQQVKRSCCGSSSSPPAECARLLSNLSLSDIMMVMTSKDFKLKILEECLLQGITLPDGRAPSIDSLDRLPGLLSDPDRSPGLREAGVTVKEGPPLYRAASQVLLQHIKNLVELLPRPVQVYRPGVWWEPSHQETRYQHRIDDLFSSTEGLLRVTQLLPSFSKLLTTYPRLPGRRPVLPPHAVLEMARFGLLCLELVKWLVAGCRETVIGRENIISDCLRISGLTLSNPHLTSALALPTNTTWAASAVISVTDYVMVRCQLNLPSLPCPALVSALELPGASPLLVSSSCLARLLILLEQNSPLSPHLEAALPPIICLARLPQFSDLARAPPLAFSLGWEPEISSEGVTGTISQELLHDPEVLAQAVWRINMLGWTSKAQFEETWMCLLSVLNVSREELTSQEVAVVAQSTGLVVSAITSLLVNTLALPVAGIPGARILHHPRDCPHYSLLSGRGQQLTEIQNIIHTRLEDSGAPTALPVDSSVNLERAHCEALITWAGYSPVPVAGYGAGQVSLSFLKTCMAYHEEGSEDRQSLASSVLPLFLLLREENLAAAGLDTHSCTHFLTDLFSQWLAQGGQTTPLVMLTAAVRAMLMISDIFTQETQFVWMLGALSDLYKVHPAEDELLTELLLLGISKAVSVVGFLEPDLYERLRKGLEAGLRSGQLSTRAACVHSLLYLLQRDSGVETPGFFILAIDHLKANMLGGRVMTDVDQHSLLLWSLMFFTLENCEPDILDCELSEALTQVAVTTAGQPGLCRLLYTSVLGGLERLVVGGLVRGRMLERLVKQVTDLMTDWPPVTVLPALQLFLAAMYCSHPLTPGTRPTTLSDPETLMQMMEQMSILFDCVRRSGPSQAQLLAEIIPRVLIDFFPASDVVNRVISEFISPGQPHPALLAGVLKMIFRAAVSQDQQNMLTEWVLVSLPNFTRRAPLSHSIWCLSCFFLAASSNPWLQAMFPHLQHKQPSDFSTPHEDKRLFCLAASDFYAGLSDSRQKKKFIQTFEDVSSPGSPYSELLATIEHRTSQS